MDKKWYVVHTYSGYESKVKSGMEERLKNSAMQERVYQILVPTEDVVEIKGGKKKISTRKYFPGYIMIQMEMDDEIWYVIKNTPKVTGFLGGTKPIPLDDAEVNRLLEQLKGESTKPKPKFMFEKGERVRVIDGPFANFSGVIEEMNMDKGKVRVMVTIFGRATPVELEFSQVEKV
ncbi:MAG: transcription termination/antitermination protein NusG [Nitrospinota bacterium]|jgi:transcriptional antiterminator NusG